MKTVFFASLIVFRDFLCLDQLVRSDITHAQMPNESPIFRFCQHGQRFFDGAFQRLRPADYQVFIPPSRRSNSVFAGARRCQRIRPQSVYIKDQPSWPISVSNCIHETYDLGETLTLGGGFRTLAGPPAVSDGRHNGFQDRCIMYYSFIYTVGLKY
jgi:hypothetical protein